MMLFLRFLKWSIRIQAFYEKIEKFGVLKLSSQIKNDHISNKELISKTCKHLKNLYKQTNKQTFFKWKKTWTGTSFPKRKILNDL